MYIINEENYVLCVIALIGKFAYGLGYELDNPVFESWQGQILYYSPKLLDWVWVLPCLLLNGYRHYFHEGKLAGS